MYLKHCKNLCKYYNVLLPSTTIIKKKKKRGRETEGGRERERERENNKLRY
jgi:hypothetical protein